MNTVTLLAQVDASKCNGCRICVRICPTLSIEIQAKKAVVDAETCSGCANCEQRCPEYAVTMVKRDVPVTVGVFLEGVDRDQIRELCATVCARSLPREVGSGMDGLSRPGRFPRVYGTVFRAEASISMRTSNF